MIPFTDIDGRHRLRDRLYLVLAVRTGYRCHELLSMRCSSVFDYTRGEVRRDVTVAARDRVKQQTFYLLLPPNDVINIPESLSSEEKMVWLQSLAREELAKISAFILYHNWRESQIKRRGREQDDIDQAVRLTLKTPVAERRRTLVAVRSTESQEKDNRIAAQNRAGAESHRQGAPRRMPPHILSGMPPHNGATEAVRAKMIRTALSESSSNLGALLFLVQSTSFLSLQDIGAATVVTHGQAHYLETPVPFLARGEVNENLHLSAGEHFRRRISDDLAMHLRLALKTIPHEQFPLEMGKWLARFRVSVGQAVYALRWNSPIWENYSWLLPEFGLAPVQVIDGKPRASGYRSYLVWNPAQQESRHLELLHLHGLSAKPDPAVKEIGHCGSRYCVKPEISSQLFRTLDDLITHATDHLPDDFLEMASLLNAIAAGIRLLEVLLTFRRNYPEPAPAVTFSNGRLEMLYPVELIHEKIRPRPVVYPPFLQEKLFAVAHIFARAESLLIKQGYTIIRPETDSNHQHAYGFLPLGGGIGKTIPVHEPRKSLITQDLLCHPATEGFTGIHPNSMRDLSYYILTSDGELEKEAMPLHDHFPSGGAGALDKHSFLPIALRELRIAAATKIVDYLGLSR